MKQNTLRILKSCGLAIIICGVGIYNTVHRNNHPESINNSVDYQLNVDYQAHPVASFIGGVIPGIIVGFAFYWLSSWRARRKQEKLKQVGDVKFYDEVARELQEKSMVAGLWTKAYAEMNGDDAKTRALYIRYRVQQLQDRTQTNVKQKSGKPPLLKPPILKADN